MNLDRIRQLEAFLEAEPNDPFTKYALALEHLESDNLKSKALFEDLLENHPAYIGTYYHAAALYTELDEREKAEQTYQVGIEKAKQANELHALQELQNAYTNFQFEE